MVKVALIGAGKMGLSHLSILGAHPNVENCRSLRYLKKWLWRFLKGIVVINVFSDYLKMGRGIPS